MSKKKLARTTSAGFRMIKDEVQEAWSGEDDVSNVVLLKAHAGNVQSYDRTVKMSGTS